MSKGDEAAAMFLLGQMANSSDEDLRRENDKLKRDKAQLEGELDDAEKKCDDRLARALSDQVASAIDEKVVELEDAIEDRLRVELEREKADDDLAKASEEINRLRARLTAEQKNCEEKLVKQVQQCTEEKKGLAQKNADLQALIDTGSNVQLKELERIKAEKSELESKKAGLKRELEGKEAALEAVQNKCKEEKANLRNQLEGKEAALKAAEEKCEEEKTELKAKEAALKASQEKCDKEKTDLKNQLEGKESELESAKEKCEEEKAVLEAKFTQEKQEWKKEKSKLESDLKVLEEKQSGESKTAEENTQLKAKIEQLETSAEEKAAKLTTAIDQKTADDKKIAELERQAAEQKAADNKKIAELERQATEQKAADDKKIAELERQATEQKTATDNLREELEKFQDIVIASTEGETKTTAATITQILENREKELKDTRAKLKTMQDNFRIVTNEIFPESKDSETNMDPENALRELRKNEEERKKRLRELQGMAAAESDTVRNNLSDEIASLNNRLDMADAECDTKKRDLGLKIDNLKNQHKLTLEQNADLETENFNLKNDIQKQKTDLDDKAAEARNLIKTLAKKEASIANLTNKNTQAANEMAILEQKLKDLEEKSSDNFTETTDTEFQNLIEAVDERSFASLFEGVGGKIGTILKIRDTYEKKLKDYFAEMDIKQDKKELIQEYFRALNTIITRLQTRGTDDYIIALKNMLGTFDRVFKEKQMRIKNLEIIMKRMKSRGDTSFGSESKSNGTRTQVDVELENQVIELENQVNDLMKQIELKNKTIRLREIDINELKTKLLTSRVLSENDQRNFQSRLHEIEEIVGNLTQKLQLAKKENASLRMKLYANLGESKENYENLPKKVSDLEATISNLEKNKSELKKGFKDLKDRHADQINDLYKILEEKDRTIESLNNQIYTQQVPSDGRSKVEETGESKSKDIRERVREAADYLVQSIFWNKVDFSPSSGGDSHAKNILSILSANTFINKVVTITVTLNDDNKENIFSGLLAESGNHILMLDTNSDEFISFKKMILDLENYVKKNFLFKDDASSAVGSSADEMDLELTNYQSELLQELEKMRAYLRREGVRKTVDSVLKIEFSGLIKESINKDFAKLKEDIKKANDTILKFESGPIPKFKRLQALVEKVRYTLNLKTNQPRSSRSRTSKRSTTPTRRGSNLKPEYTNLRLKF